MRTLFKIATFVSLIFAATFMFSNQLAYAQVKDKEVNGLPVNQLEGVIDMLIK